MLAHKAEEEGVAVAEIIANGHGHVNYKTLPSVVYTWPEAASVGWTQEQAQGKRNRDKNGAFSFHSKRTSKSFRLYRGFCENYF